MKTEYSTAIFKDFIMCYLLCKKSFLWKYVHFIIATISPNYENNVGNVYTELLKYYLGQFN